MKIGIDASRANRKYKSGTEWYAYHIIRWLAKLDDKNQYILYTDEPLKGGLINLEKEFEKKEEVEEIKIDKNGYQKISSPHKNFKAKILRWPFKYFWSQGRLSLEMFFNKPDLLFVPAHTLPIIHPKKSVVTIHDIAYERYEILYQKEEIGPEKKKRKKFLNYLIKLFTFGKFGANSFDYLRWSTNYTLKKAYRVIVPSNYTKEDIKSLYKNNFDNIVTIYHGFDKQLYRKIDDKEEIDNILGKYQIEKPFFFYIGRNEKKKNTPALVEAFGIFKELNKSANFKLLIVGNASYGYDEVNYMISEFGLEKDVIMPGWIKEKHIPYLYNSATAFIFPSKYEGFGIPLLQAMACEVPILASDRSSIPEVTKGAAILFDPDDVRSIVRSMERIVEEKDTKAKLIELGRERSKMFSWEKSAKETLELFNSISVF